ncbi:DJ-1/PfpI family protein [Xylogone sp. PMI_703]|nr:DJ-1/PfpI family protein [Xylogone sp. PMI_703]
MAATLPINYGLVLFPGFQALDVFGPIDALNTLSRQRHMKLFILAETLEPVSTEIPAALGLKVQSTQFHQTVNPTHTFDNPPAEKLDVLIVPGGLGTRPQIESIKPVIEYVAKVYPDLQHIITVCTGSGVLARTGFLDGKKATTNKAAFDGVVALRPSVNWIKKARWVRDGNIWSSAGVSAGVDVTLAFIEEIYGREIVDLVTDRLEYDRHEDPNWDPFTERWEKRNNAAK